MKEKYIEFIRETLVKSELFTCDYDQEHNPDLTLATEISSGEIVCIYSIIMRLSHLKLSALKMRPQLVVNAAKGIISEYKQIEA